MSDTNLAADNNNTTPPPEGETETKARRLGWVSRDEFKGDPEHHRSAAEFLERGERLLPLLQRDNDKLHRRISEVEGLLKETRDASKELLEFTSKSEQRAYERAKSEIQARIEQAAANADPNTVRTEMANLDALDKQHERPVAKTETKKETTPQIDPEIQDWLGKNDWYAKDRSLNAYATDTYAELERDKPGMSTAEKLAETKRLTTEKFPEKFGINPKRDGVSAVGTPSGGNAPTRRNAKSYENLPEDAKRACDKFVRTIDGYTKEKYVKDYDWGD